MTWFSAEHLQALISAYGYGAVGVIVGLESMGLPLPGETVLVVAALYAGTHPDLSIWCVIVAAAIGAILGDNLGFWLGREFGYWLLLRYGRFVGLSDARIKVGQYLFQRHGGKAVFFGRFIPALRILAAFLAGLNRMEWRRFLIANAAGGIVWAGTISVAAYSLGKVLFEVTGPAAFALGFAGLAGFFTLALYLRTHEAELEAEAERAMPGPLPPVHRFRTRRLTSGRQSRP